MFFQDLSDSQKTYARRVFLVFITVVTLFAVAYTGYYFSLWKQVKRADRTPFQISVSGEGKIAAKPDVAQFNVIVKTENSVLKEAQKENSEKSVKLTNFLKSSGVAEKDIKTSYYKISPQYQYYDDDCVRIQIYPPRPCPPFAKPKIIGYQVTNAYEIKVRDLAKAGDILEGVVSAGANEVSGLSFTIDDPEGARAEARKKAIDDAQAKAKVLSNQLGVRLGRIVSFNESGGGSPIFYERALGAAKADGGATASVPVEPGEQEILVNVTITYEMR